MKKNVLYTRTAYLNIIAIHDLTDEELIALAENTAGGRGEQLFESNFVECIDIDDMNADERIILDQFLDTDFVYKIDGQWTNVKPSKQQYLDRALDCLMSNDYADFAYITNEKELDEAIKLYGKRSGVAEKLEFYRYLFN